VSEAFLVPFTESSLQISYLRGVSEESFNQDLYSEFEGHEAALIHYLADILALFRAL